MGKKLHFLTSMLVLVLLLVAGCRQKEVGSGDGNGNGGDGKPDPLYQLPSRDYFVEQMTLFLQENYDTTEDSVSFDNSSVKEYTKESVVFEVTITDNDESHVYSHLKPQEAQIYQAIYNRAKELLNDVEHSLVFSGLLVENLELVGLGEYIMPPNMTNDFYQPLLQWLKTTYNNQEVVFAVGDVNPFTKDEIGLKIMLVDTLNYTNALKTQQSKVEQDIVAKAKDLAYDNVHELTYEGKISFNLTLDSAYVLPALVNFVTSMKQFLQDKYGSSQEIIFATADVTSYDKGNIKFKITLNDKENSSNSLNQATTKSEIEAKAKELLKSGVINYEGGGVAVNLTLGSSYVVVDPDKPIVNPENPDEVIDIVIKQDEFYGYMEYINELNGIGPFRVVVGDRTIAQVVVAPSNDGDKWGGWWTLQGLKPGKTFAYFERVSDNAKLYYINIIVE